MTAPLLAAEPPVRYATVLADPPWEFGSQGSSPPPYRPMPLEDICALPVERLVADNSHLWLWVTNPSLFAGRTVMEAWGFRYIGCLTWIKPRMGMGGYLRNATEHLLFGVRGRAPIQFRGQPTWLFAPVQDHSHKPEETYSVIERCSPGPYLELFARRPRLGWHVWGDEVVSDVHLPPRQQVSP